MYATTSLPKVSRRNVSAKLHHTPTSTYTSTAQGVEVRLSHARACHGVFFMPFRCYTWSLPALERLPTQDPPKERPRAEISSRQRVPAVRPSPVFSKRLAIVILFADLRDKVRSLSCTRAITQYPNHWHRSLPILITTYANKLIPASELSSTLGI
ncbi:hypothetical protein VNO77_44611 [Canavalia gladiata]|uniref:Uncharacterized protein n=1 Tax=Canavalia gladiata TaxID=3824 RepID=A0AAN9JYE7_CANGL